MEIDDELPTHPMRKKVYNKFLDVLRKYAYIVLKDEYLQVLSLNIERGIFNYILDNYNTLKMSCELFKHYYSSRAAIIYLNLNPDSSLQNRNLMYRLLNNEINEFELTRMGSDKLFPERHLELISEYNTEIEVYGLDKNIEDGILKCGKCKSYKTSYYEVQTRGADEPTTKFCTCHICGNIWKFC
jgi:DNA-directed RNA polymerase subunit M/transcription elongation factor TFIIS